MTSFDCFFSCSSLVPHSASSLAASAYTVGIESVIGASGVDNG
jgi:hypothetical protein